jgi:hypothetical protein
MATTTARVTAVQASYTAASAGESALSVYTETDSTVVFAFAASLPAASVDGLPLPAGWSNFNGVTGANLYVKAISQPALVSLVKS